MGRLILSLSVCAASLLLCIPAQAQDEPVVKAWGNYIVVTAPAESNTPRDIAAREALGRRTVSFNFKETPFADAIEFLRTASALNFVIDRNAGVEGQNVNLALKEVSVQTALEFLTKQLSLTWTVRDGVVIVGHKEDLAPPMRTGVYEVTDLIAIPPDFPGPAMTIQPGFQQPKTPFDPWRQPTTAPDKPEAGGERTRAQAMQELVDIVSGMLKSGGDTRTAP